MKSMTLQEKILYLLILFFLTTLYLPWIPVLNIMAAGALIVYALTFSSLKEKWKLLEERTYLQGMLLFIAVVMISVVLSKNFNKGLSFLSPRLPLLYLTASVGTLRLRKEFRDKVLLGFAYLTTFILLICLGWGLHRSDFFRYPEFLYNDALTEILGQQSIYISLLVNFSIYIFTYFLFYKKFAYKGVMCVCLLFLFVSSYLLASRIMIGVLYAAALGFAFYYIVTKKKYLEGATLIVGLVIGAFLIFKFFPSTLNRFKELEYTKFSYQSMGKESHYNMQVDSTQWNGANFRLAAWQCGWQLFKEHPVMGVHIGDKKDKLFDIYRQKNFQFAIQTNKNVHNNYLDILYSMGIIGFVVFIMGWLVLPLLKAWHFKDGLAIVMILTFAAGWITEIYLDRSLGGMLVGFFIPFILTPYRKKERQL